MTIEFHCPFCQKLLRTAEDKAGVRANCPGCGESVTVPSAGDVLQRPAPAHGTVGAEPSADADAAGSNALAGQVESSGSGTATAALSPPRPGTRNCPMCGEPIMAAATRCRYCGEELVAGISRTGRLAPHRGGMILALGSIGFVMLVVAVFCLPLGIFALPLGVIAWVLGNSDLREMAAARMDREGEGLTQAGRIFGIITCCLALLMVVFFAVFFVVVIFNMPH